jgi:hypothetical protein
MNVEDQKKSINENDEFYWSKLNKNCGFGSINFHKHTRIKQEKKIYKLKLLFFVNLEQDLYKKNLKSPILIPCVI